MTGIGSRIKRIRDNLGLTQQEFAEHIGTKQQNLSRYESETLSVPDEIKEKLHAIGINLNWLILGEGSEYLKEKQTENEKPEPLFEASERSESTPETQKPIPILKPIEIASGGFIIPILDQKVSAGTGSYLPEKDIPNALLPVPSYLSRYGKNIAAVTVEGDSMEPTFRRGDLVVCDSLGWSGEGVYVIRIDGADYVKRLTRAPGTIVILSDNKQYPVREEPIESQAIEIVGRVHCAVRRVE